MQYLYRGFSYFPLGEMSAVLLYYCYIIIIITILLLMPCFVQLKLAGSSRRRQRREKIHRIVSETVSSINHTHAPTHSRALNLLSKRANWTRAAVEQGKKVEDLRRKRPEPYNNILYWNPRFRRRVREIEIRSSVHVQWPPDWLNHNIHRVPHDNLTISIACIMLDLIIFL